MSRKVFILLILLSILITSCTTLTSITSLKNGKLPTDNNEDPILVFQVEVIDHTGILEENRYAFLPKVKLQKIDEYEIAENIEISSAIKTSFWSGKLEKPGWVKDGDYSVFRENYFTSAKPGEYSIDNINLYLGSTSSSGYNSTTTSYTQFFYAEKGFTLEAGTLYVLGTIRLEISKIDGQFPNYAFTSNLTLDNSKGNIKLLLEDFINTYPDASGKYDIGASTVSPYFMNIEDFTLMNYRIKDWNSFKSEAVDYLYYNNKYVLKKKIEDGNYNYMQCNRTFNLSGDFEITWESALVNGDTEETYGLMIGPDPENCFFFYLNGSGVSGIAHLVKNEWQENPAVHTEEIDGNNIFNLRRHHLIGRGDSIKYYIDEEFIGETGAPFETNPLMLSFFISGKSMIEFDNLFIRGR